METSNNTRILIMGQESTIDAAEIFRTKYESKQNFIKAQNDVYSLFDKNILSHGEIQEKCAKMDDCMEATMNAMDTLSDWYANLKDYQKVNEVVVEMEKIEQEYAAIYEKMWSILKNVKIDNNIVQPTTEQNKEQKPQSKLPEEFQNTGHFDRYHKTNIFLQRSSENKAHTASGFNLNEITSDSNSVAVRKASSSTEGKRPISSERSTLKKMSTSKRSRMEGKDRVRDRGRRLGSRGRIKVRYRGRCIRRCQVKGRCRRPGRCRVRIRITDRDRGRRIRSRVPPKSRERGRRVGRSRGRIKSRDRNKRLRSQGGDRGRCLGVCRYWCQIRRSSPRCRCRRKCRRRISGRQRGQSRIQGRYGSLGKDEDCRRNRYLGAGRSLRRDSCREGSPKMIPK